MERINRRALRSGERIALLLVSTFLLLISGHVRADDESTYREVDGLSVYLGVMPAAIVRGHPRAHPERKMHDGASAAEGMYHVVIAVFDSATGQRLSDFSVEAAVLSPGRSMSQKPLERMAIADTVTFGNYFAMASSGEHRILVDIVRPGAQRPVRAEFTHVLRTR